MVSALLISNLLFPEPSAESYGLAEAFGYATIFASLGLIYLAMNEVQNRNEEGEVMLWQKIVLGVMVSAFAGVMFGIYNVVYTTYINPEFMESYYNHYISQLPVQSGPEYEATVAQLEQEKAMFMHPATQFGAMAATVLAAGIPVSILLALLHSRKPKKI